MYIDCDKPSAYNEIRKNGKYDIFSAYYIHTSQWESGLSGGYGFSRLLHLSPSQISFFFTSNPITTFICLLHYLKHIRK